MSKLKLDVRQWAAGLAAGALAIAVCLGCASVRSDDEGWAPKVEGAYLGITIYEAALNEARVFSDGKGSCEIYTAKPELYELIPYALDPENAPQFAKLGELVLACLNGEAQPRTYQGLVLPGAIFSAVLHFDLTGTWRDCGDEIGGSVLACNYIQGGDIYVVEDRIEDTGQLHVALGHEVWHSVCPTFHDSPEAGVECFNQFK